MKAEAIKAQYVQSTASQSGNPSPPYKASPPPPPLPQCAEEAEGCTAKAEAGRYVSLVFVLLVLFFTKHFSWA